MKTLAENSKTTLIQKTLLLKFRGYADLLKMRLSFLVVFSAGMGYMLGIPSGIDGIDFFLFLLGGFLMTGGANTTNQIIERDLDLLMKRTCKRPLPTKVLTVNEAIFFAAVLTIAGFAILLFCINTLTAIITLISSLLYAFLYTPLKRKSSIAVLVGAIPGALPPLIGWVAATNSFGIEAILLFAIQFFWQFPHFWAIAWVLDEDYRKAGFKLLPFGGKKNLNTAFQIMIYTMMLIPLGIIPAKLGLTGMTSAVIITLCGVIFLAQTFNLMRECSVKAARLIMFGSFLYLPIVQIALVWDKL